VETSAGSLGLGVASPEEDVTGESIAASEAALSEENLNKLIGLELEIAIKHLDFTEGLPAARVSVEMALLDALSREKKKSLCEFLGGAKHKTLPTSITIGIMNVQETIEEATEYLERGFTMLKVKLGKDRALDTERIIKLREKLGHGFGILVDVNQGYDAAGFESFFKEVDKYGIAFYEQPIKVKDSLKIGSLDKNIRDKVALDEAVQSPEDARRFTSPTVTAGIINIKLMKAGGIKRAIEIAEIADKSGVDLMWGCMDESRISIAAALHTAFSCKATRYLDLDGHLDLAKDIAEGGFVIQDGQMSLLGGRIGLGVDLI
jgi:L-Ala-D/L-Glu epimerase